MENGVEGERREKKEEEGGKGTVERGGGWREKEKEWRFGAN